MQGNVGTARFFLAWFVAGWFLSAVLLLLRILLMAKRAGNQSLEAGVGALSFPVGPILLWSLLGGLAAVGIAFALRALAR